jgi:GNAT superfamily N-acetyltransferase
MARLILSLEPDKIALVDEFTSVVDREVAKICSAAVQKMVRKEKKQMIAISCHYDIAEWLEPDWIYHVDTGEFKITRGILRRPRVNLHIEKVHKDAWDFFKGHHYLSADIHAAAQCFVGFINGQPIGFAAAMFFPHPHVKNMWKGHRTVVLPDYQGIGLGNAMSEAVGDYYIDQGFRYTSLTSHPAMIGHRVRSKKWIMTRAPSSTPPVGAKGKLKGCANSSDRMTASFEYIGDRLK